MRIWDIHPADSSVIDTAGRKAPLDPMRRGPRIPRGATNIPPPEIGERETARWTGEAWEVVPDWRGHVYWTEDGQRHEINELGIEPPAEALDEEPPEALDKFANRQRTAIDTARDEAFAAGLPYDIAGHADIVQTRPLDQINLLGLSAKAQRLNAAGETGTVMPFRGLSNETRMLTPEQMDALTLAALAHIEGIYGRSWARKDVIDAILADEGLSDEEKRAAIEAVAW